MKIFVLLIIALLLTGCAGESGQAEVPPEETAIEAAEESIPVQQVEKKILPTPDNRTFVVVLDYLPEIQVELKYATTDNFTGQIIYDFEECYLRYGTVAKLAAVQADLQQLGLGLKIWDGFL